MSALQNGVGGEAQFRYTPGALSVGAGFQFTIHELEERTESAHFYGGFVEPRYRIHAGSNVVAPYVSARFAVLKVGFSGEDLSLSSTFLELNGGGGILVRLGPRVNLDVGATLGYNHLGKGTLIRQVGATRVTVPVTSTLWLESRGSPGTGDRTPRLTGSSYSLGVPTIRQPESPPLTPPSRDDSAEDGPARQSSPKRVLPDELEGELHGRRVPSEVSLSVYPLAHNRGPLLGTQNASQPAQLVLI